MADNLPENPPAPAPASSQAPAPAPGAAPADNAPAPQLTLESFSDDEQAYLKSQGVTDFTTPESIKKIINHAQSSQKTAAQLKVDYDKVRDVVNPPANNPNPFAPVAPQPSTTPNNPTPPDPATPPTPSGPDSVQMYLLANTLGGQFPELVEDLTSGKFYQDMQTVGIPLLVNGQVNLAGITTFGKSQQIQKQYEAKIADLNKPNEGNQPPAEPSAPQQPAADAPMTKQMALAIGQFVAAGNPHARGEEAKAFLAKGV